MLTIQSDNGKQGYKVGGNKILSSSSSPFPEALANGIAAIGFGDTRNPEPAVWSRVRLGLPAQSATVTMAPEMGPPDGGLVCT